MGRETRADRPKQAVSRRLRDAEDVSICHAPAVNHACCRSMHNRSAFRVRIYDKALERGESGHWVRVELVMRGENAQAFGRQIINAENVGKLAAQVINEKFSFIEKDDSSHVKFFRGWRWAGKFAVFAIDNKS